MRTGEAAIDRLSLTGKERIFPDGEIIVSKTDPKGIMTYVNDIFIKISGYDERELIGRPHSLIRHPHMPRCIFKLLWDTISAGDEVFAYVNNRCKNGDNYWVLAHVTPTWGPQHTLLGYHSNRRSPSSQALAVIRPLYQQLLDEEQKHANSRAALDASTALFQQIISQTGKNYDEFVLSL